MICCKCEAAGDMRLHATTGNDSPPFSLCVECDAALTKTAPVSMGTVPRTRHLSCAHGRFIGQPCPHCLGV